MNTPSFVSSLVKQPAGKLVTTPEKYCLVNTYEMEKHTLLNKVEEIKNRINKIADQWLQ
jgi:hypothetical protein